MSSIGGKKVNSLLSGAKLNALYNPGTIPSHSSKAALIFFALECSP